MRQSSRLLSVAIVDKMERLCYYSLVILNRYYSDNLLIGVDFNNLEKKMTTATVGKDWLTVNLITRKIIECRLSQIELNPKDAESIELKQREDSSSWVALKFSAVPDAKSGLAPYIVISDNRSRAVEIYENEGIEAYSVGFDVIAMPCLFAFRKKLGYYIVLADIGTKDIADGKEEGRILTTQPYNKAKYRIVVNKENTGAIHDPTGICVIEPRLPKAA